MSAPGKHASSGTVNIHYQDTGSGPPPPPDFVMADPAVFSKLFTPPAGATTIDEIVGNVWSSIAGPGFPERGREVIDRLVTRAVERPTPLEVIMLQMQAIATRTGDPA